MNVSFDSSSGEDHVVQMMQVFSIMQWQTEGLPLITQAKERPKNTISFGYF